MENQLEIKYKNNSHSTILVEKDGVAYITFPKLSKAGVIHGMSTRIGGVSKGYLGKMNLSYHRGDEKEAVDENHRRFAKALGYDEKKLVFSDQVHDVKIHKVTKEDAGKGITKESDIIGIDGLMTNAVNIPLITFYADCVPLFFYDKKNQVIAMAHSGWRGCVAKIGQVMLQEMKKEYGTDPGNVIAAIGPSICQDCYEISEDVALAFRHAFSKEQYGDFMIDKKNGKYQLDLQKACEYVLLDAGILKENLDVTDICTCCNSDVLFSHRASNGKRGNLGAVMVLQG